MTELREASSPTAASYTGVTGDPMQPGRSLDPYRQFRLAAELHPDKVALVHPEGELDFRALDDVVHRLASGLRNLGVRQGEAFAVVLGNHWEQLAFYLAAGLMGSVVMSASRYLKPAEIAYQLDEARPRLVVGEGGLAIDAVLAAATGRIEPARISEYEPIQIRFSSGTTGKPKMMLASRRSQALLFSELCKEMQLTPRDRQMVVAPLAHAALQLGLAQLAAGGSLIVRPGFDKDAFWDDCARFGITNIMVVPTMIAAALAVPGTAPQLRALVSLGATLRPALKQKLAERFPHVGLYEMYGASELGMVTCLRPDEQAVKPATVGRPAFGQEVAIFDDEGRPVAGGEIGTIYARGPQAISCYLGSQQPKPAPAHLVADGWMTTGDLGSLDADGFLTISDRRADLILSGAMNVYPAEVEAVLAAQPGVRDVAIVGTADEIWGQRVTAYIVGDMDQAALESACRELLAAYKMPRAWFAVDALPLTSNGKISRTLLREAIGRGEYPC